MFMRMPWALRRCRWACSSSCSPGMMARLLLARICSMSLGTAMEEKYLPMPMNICTTSFSTRPRKTGTPSSAIRLAS